MFLFHFSFVHDHLIAVSYSSILHSARDIVTNAHVVNSIYCPCKEANFNCVIWLSFVYCMNMIVSAEQILIEIELHCRAVNWIESQAQIAQHVSNKQCSMMCCIVRLISHDRHHIPSHFFSHQNDGFDLTTLIWISASVNQLTNSTPPVLCMMFFRHLFIHVHIFATFEATPTLKYNQR